MTTTTNYLVTGAARGIGRGLVTSLAIRPNTIVVATVRDTAAENARSLAALPTHASSRIVVLKLDSSNPKAAAADGAKVVADLIAQRINHLDIVVANAGIAKSVGPDAQVSADDFLEHFYVNTLGPLLLFQAVWPGLLSKSTKPIFVGVSTLLASIETMYPLRFTAYGTSKAALNYIVKKIAQENEGLIAFPIHPGWVQTDMGNDGARQAGLKEAPETLEQSVTGLLKSVKLVAFASLRFLLTLIPKIDGADKETSGKFLSFDGSTIPW